MANDMYSVGRITTRLIYIVGCLVTAAIVFFGATAISKQSNGSAMAEELRAQTSETKWGPPHYCARTDRKMEGYPERAPILKAAGSGFQDPAFGSRILRVTDGHTAPGPWAGHFTLPIRPNRMLGMPMVANFTCKGRAAISGDQQHIGQASFIRLEVS